MISQHKSTVTSGPCDSSRDGVLNMAPNIALTLMGHYGSIHNCRYLGDARRQVISSNGFGYVGLTGRKVACLQRGRTYTTGNISVSENENANIFCTYYFENIQRINAILVFET